MTHKWQIALVVYFVGLALTSFLTARSPSQIDGGSISGIVTDSYGAVIPNITIVALPQSASAQSENKRFEVIVDNNGRFQFDNLPVGIYEIRVDEPPSLFKPALKRDVHVQRSQNTKVDLQLKSVEACDDILESEVSDISDSDKAEIVKLTLEDALVKKKIPDYNMLIEQRGNIVLSTENIKPDWIPNLSGYKLTLLSPAEIQRKGDFLYLSFDEFKVKGSCVAVTLTNSWAVGKKSGMGYLSGGGFTYEYRKQSGKWIGKWIQGWIS